jgi:hypothetical protein
MDAEAAKAVLAKHNFRPGIDGTANVPEPARSEIKAACNALKAAEQAAAKAKR